jgi:hypothetical protein
MHRSYDASLLKQAYESTPIDYELDCEMWFDNPGNVMLVEGDDV